jgi:hypothetical protein
VLLISSLLLLLRLLLRLNKSLSGNNAGSVHSRGRWNSSLACPHTCGLRYGGKVLYCTHTADISFIHGYDRFEKWCCRAASVSRRIGYRMLMNTASFSNYPFILFHFSLSMYFYVERMMTLLAKYYLTT